MYDWLRRGEKSMTWASQLTLLGLEVYFRISYMASG